MFNKRVLARVLIVRRLRNKLRRTQRSSYIRPIFLNRNLQGDSILVEELRNDPEYHFKYFRMDKENFDVILSRVQSKLFHHQTHARPISAIDRLAITLRFLATGNSQVSLALNFRISPSAVGVILRETMAAISESFQEEFLPTPSKEIWIQNEKEFSTKWNFPNACGSLDGKHIRIKSPSASGTDYYNYKSFFSIVLLAISNPNYMFTAVDIGSPGSNADGGILRNSQIGTCLETNIFYLPDAKPIFIGGDNMPCVLLGDSGFPLETNLLTPFRGAFLSKQHRIFNYRLSRARMVVENSFGILAARWRIFHSAIPADPDFVKLITLTAVILHNFLLSKKDFNAMTVDRVEGGVLVPGSWREITQNDDGLSNLSNQGSNNYSKNAAQIREKFMEYFSREGSVSWQNKHVLR